MTYGQVYCKKRKSWATVSTGNFSTFCCINLKQEVEKTQKSAEAGCLKILSSPNFFFFTVMVTHTRNSCSAFNPAKVHTHTVNTHPEQWAAIYAAAPGEKLRVRCLAQGHLSRGIEGGESAVHSLPPPTIPAGPETRTRNLWVTSSTL